MTNIVSTPDPSRLYLFRVGVYNEFGTRGFSDAWSAPLDLSLYYGGDRDSEDEPTSSSLDCSGTYGQYPKMPTNLTRVGEMKIEANGSVAVNVSWNPPREREKEILTANAVFFVVSTSFRDRAQLLRDRLQVQ